MNTTPTPNSFSQVAASMLAGKYLTFRLGTEEYGLEITKVQEIIGLLPVTHIPRAPAYMRGIVNLRGRIIPTMDLRAKFGLQPVPDTGKTCIIVVEVQGPAAGKISIGLIVDEVAEVVNIAADCADHVSHFAGNIAMNYIQGVGVVNDGVKMLLDVDQVMSFEDVKVIQKALPAGKPA